MQCVVQRGSVIIPVFASSRGKYEAENSMKNRPFEQKISFEKRKALLIKIIIQFTNFEMVFRLKNPF